jgi:Fanconi anemia group M protein
MKYFHHPLIRPESIENRAYQQSIVNTSLKRNTLVILPTALGKTVISLLLSIHRLHGKILILAPTRPLVLQHFESFKRFLLLQHEEFSVLTGKTPPEERESLWKKATFIFATPQVVRNDIQDGRYTLDDVTLIVFDEAHRARKRYAYTYLAEIYMNESKDPRILALTASPGQSLDIIKETCEALYIQAVEYRSENDKDVLPYLPRMSVKWRETKLPASYERIKNLLEKMLDGEISQLKKLQLIPESKRRVSKGELLDLGEKLRSALERTQEKGFLYEAIVLQSVCISLHHALEILTTQDIKVLKKFLTQLGKKESRSARRIVRNPIFKELMEEVEKNLSEEHPKLGILKRMIQEELFLRPSSRIIVFTQYRETAKKIIDALSQIKNARPVRFVGQASKLGDSGLSQNLQAEILEKFRNGIHNILVATSIAEEGLDIPTVDLVIFYEPVPSEIRSIQRRGRTARKRFGRVEILITKGTIDEAYYWSSKIRERKMRRIVSELSNELIRRGQLRLSDFR